MMTTKNEPAKHLKGKELVGRWVIGERIIKPETQNSKTFAETYIVQRDGQKAILKALDFSIALRGDNPPAELIQLAKLYEFERELLELCQNQKLDKIITILDTGNIPPIEDSIIPVPYFILEYAEMDVKSQINFDSRLNTAWLLRILHSVTVGLWQLHRNGVAYKNLRPENILEFRKEIQKITELGKSDRRGEQQVGENQDSLNDAGYLTPEFLYGHEEKDWIYRSQAMDAYQLGSLIFFLFTQTNINLWLDIWLDESHKWNNWGGTYEEVLPYVVEAYDKAVNMCITHVEGDELKIELENVLRQLCHPDPRKRGHPKNLGSADSSLSVERFISIFDRLRRMAEMNLLKEKENGVIQ